MSLIRKKKRKPGHQMNPRTCEFDHSRLWSNMGSRLRCGCCPFEARAFCFSSWHFLGSGRLSFCRLLELRIRASQCHGASAVRGVVIKHALSLLCCPWLCFHYLVLCIRFDLIANVVVGIVCLEHLLDLLAYLSLSSFSLVHVSIARCMVVRRLTAAKHVAL